ncbi:winged helix-turn-helix domain-containing protein [Gallaecimonas sp. GXIMD4217]|uniref:winged helix-turn-helix domain-containing protein n=1 Tax=Gallaecimonas sp. GXIMD4217 TaxID=3131927 RepID=UPI00311B1C31
MTAISRTQTATFRRYYFCHLIASGINTVPAIMEATGMPRRTVQDTLKSLEEIGVRCGFEQSEGARHNQGHYRILDWGPIKGDWIAAHLDDVKAVLA